MSFSYHPIPAHPRESGDPGATSTITTVALDPRFRGDERLKDKAAECGTQADIDAYASALWEVLK